MITKEKRRLYKLHYLVRKAGIKLYTKQKTISVQDDTNKYVSILQNQYGYSLQYELNFYSKS